MRAIYDSFAKEISSLGSVLSVGTKAMKMTQAEKNKEARNVELCFLPLISFPSPKPINATDAESTKKFSV